MELRHLRYFAAVAAHGSFSRAANNLHLTQPALSRQVKDLEDELGVPLFLRGTNAVTLTDAGELFYEEARDLLSRADQAIQRVRGETKTDVLRVGYAPSLTSGIMPRAIERFQTATPRVRLELADLSPLEMTGKASAGLLDLIVLPEGLESQVREFTWTDLRTLAPVVVAPRDHPLAKLKKIAPKRLKNVPLHGLGRRNFPEYAPRMRAILKPFGVTPLFVDQSADGLATLFAGLEASHTITILSDGIASVLPASLVMIPFSPALASMVIKMGMPSVRPSPHAEAFARFLSEAVRSTGAKT